MLLCLLLSSFLAFWHHLSDFHGGEADKGRKALYIIYAFDKLHYRKHDSETGLRIILPMDQPKTSPSVSSVIAEYLDVVNLARSQNTALTYAKSLKEF